MKKVNVEELTRKLNEFRMSNQNRTFTGKELNQKLMEEVGFSTIIASAIAQKYFPYEQVGKGRLYDVPEKPIYKDAIYAIFDKQNRRSKKQEVGSNDNIKMDQQKAWDTLVKVGVIKTKFNINTLKTRYPKIYLECLEYELDVTKQ